MNIIAVVVTYNRRELLKRNIACLRLNTPVSSIVVVNNGSTDGTGAWLDEQEDLTVIHQENVGGSGGFYRGIQYAYQAGADWIWCMDDDVFPRPDCMEYLLPYTHEPGVGILAPRRLMAGQIFTNDFQKVNLSNPFASMYQQKLKKQVVNGPVDICGTAFEGLCISRKAVAEIGLPNKELFIFCDDTDYCLRAVLAGFRILYIPSALMDKEKFFSNDNWEERSRKKKWKRFYQVRNSTYLNHHYGRNWWVRYLRGFNGMLGYLLVALFTCPFKNVYTLNDVAKFWQAYRDGIHEKLGRY
ncbi:glycosyltransferase family 2 protein [Phocaeicola plebeius]|jgi:GT2 family glycosyltransferase|uniref:Glycosyltransferase n=1 Tax=Phocaeicola plebeius TaxID=310297 RepID=A0A3E4Z8P0_9BACT|nr:glycosyltransferase family 2 protein [Phocaeicola plebeius]RGM91437.1 glycosyltransferase [Phocaeicola plebeius]RHD52308.1 glycosyltransferase [Phocaeicola plebeius]RHL00799.1 glycosyltransferase [Phocaeicola plebeius]RHL20144.1 glycosyltransferase [Phocaeicola plebeius]